MVHKNIADKLIIALTKKLDNVAIYGDAVSQGISPDILKADSDDYDTEYLDLKMSLKVVDDIHEAIDHVNTHHTHHSDAIITENKENAALFTNLVDSAAVYVNASTRFTDGFVFGLGAEIGISTQKLHARGPMGLKALTTYKYILKGNGQVR